MQADDTDAIQAEARGGLLAPEPRPPRSEGEIGKGHQREGGVRRAVHDANVGIPVENTHLHGSTAAWMPARRLAPIATNGQDLAAWG